jgi:hypothetical protein
MYTFQYPLEIIDLDPMNYHRLTMDWIKNWFDLHLKMKFASHSFLIGRFSYMPYTLSIFMLVRIIKPSKSVSLRAFMLVNSLYIHSK